MQKLFPGVFRLGRHCQRFGTFREFHDHCMALLGMCIGFYGTIQFKGLHGIGFYGTIQFKGLHGILSGQPLQGSVAQI